MEPVQTHLINDVITVQNSGIDWVAWIALGVSIFATVGTLWWQHHIRKKDLIEQRKNADADEKMRKWSAEYPYKLKVYTEFYDILHTISLIEIETLNAKTVSLLLKRMLNTCQESELFFSSAIQDKLYFFYDELKMFFEKPLDYTNESYIRLDCNGALNSGQMKHDVMKSFEYVKEHADVCKSDKKLRDLFASELQAPEGGDQCQK